MNNEIDIILARYFSGEATGKELQELDIWLSKSAENEEKFHQMTLLYQYTGQMDNLPDIYTEKAFTQFKNHIYKQKNSRTASFYLPNVWKVAAAIAILLVGTFTLLHFLNQPSKTIRLMAGETQQEFTIFENTEVTLFPGTEIIYHAQSNREVQLKGKATFTIHSETSGGILVQAGKTYIKDIGTIFTVDAHNPEHAIQVEVIEGEVWFFTETNNGVYVKANERAVYDVQNDVFWIQIDGEGEKGEEEKGEREEYFQMVENVNVVDDIVDNKPDIVETVETLYTTSLPPELVFKNTPLSAAIDLIKARYGVDITVNSSELNEVLLNVSFDHHDSVEYVLEIIAATISAHLEKQGNRYIIIAHE